MKYTVKLRIQPTLTAVTVFHDKEYDDIDAALKFYNCLCKNLIKVPDPFLTDINHRYEARVYLFKDSQIIMKTICYDTKGGVDDSEL